MTVFIHIENNNLISFRSLDVQTASETLLECRLLTDVICSFPPDENSYIHLPHNFNSK